MDLEHTLEGIRVISPLLIMSSGLIGACYLAYTSTRAIEGRHDPWAGHSNDTIGKVVISDIKGIGDYIGDKLNPFNMYNRINDKLYFNYSRLDINMREIAEKYF